MRNHRITTRTLAPLAICAALALAAAGPVVLRSSQEQGAQATQEHARLLTEVGHWEGTFTPIMPGMPEESFPATQVTEAVGSLWTQSRFECEFMGAPYVGTGCMGYDTAKQKYVGTWIDSTTTSITFMEGEMDAKKNAIVMRWEASDPATGEMVPHRSETVHTKDTHTSTFYMGEGEGTKSMVIALKRVEKKKPAEAGTAR